MKRLIGIILLVVGIIGGSITYPAATHAASQFTGGLLDGIPVQVGTSVGQPKSTVTEMTDGNVSTRGLLNSPSEMAWHTFASPVEISSIVVKSSGTSIIEFYDTNNNLLLKYKALSNDGIQTLPTTIKDVATVALKTESDYMYVYEWNVFSTPSAPPTSTTITWIQGGDQVVKFDWTNTGAASYNVKRSTSSLGPYATIANVKGTSYIDKAVTNGTTYYYVVSAVNEAGESANSPEKSMKPQATKYTGGLLDGLPLKMGSSITNPTRTVVELTDNNEATRGLLNSPSEMAWHTFASPVEISSIVVKSSGTSIIEFYDTNNNLLLKYKALSNDGIQTLPTTIKDVATVVLKTESSYMYVYEWNVFATPSAPPTSTTITWIQGGDQVVKFDWTNTGAASYNVKRSTSSLGPYATIANVKGTSYIDKAVTNGTTYYYVVSAVNEAGESANSPEKSMKPQATKYTGGLLDGLPLKIGASITNPTKTVLELTDNNEATRGALNSSGEMAWYTFASPVEVSAIILKSNGAAFVELYDASNNLLLKYDVPNNGELKNLPTPVKDVTTVVLKTTASYMYVYEWNVFGKGGEIPVDTPMNLTASAGNQKVVLNWTSTGANGTSVNVKRSLVAGGPYTTIATVTGTTYTYTDTNVLNGTTYYYVVSAVGAAGESANSNEALATPKADVVNPPDPDPGNNQPGERALLRITLNNGIEKEYDLSMAEVNAFINWYEGRASGTGTVMYAIDKHANNKGPFKNRKDYVFYDKIITFEVNGYDSGTSAPEDPEEVPNSYPGEY